LTSQKDLSRKVFITEKKLIDEWEYVRDCKPQKTKEFRAYIKGTVFPGPRAVHKSGFLAPLDAKNPQM
jgi:hypothetical protein